MPVSKKTPAEKRATIVEIICILFIMLFVYASVSKLADYHSFRVQLGKSPLLTALADWLVWMVPALEIVIVITLVIPKFRLAGLYASFSLMVMFTTYIIVLLQFSDFIPCSCGGILQYLPWTTHIIFNMVFVFLALIGILLHSYQPSNKSSTVLSDRQFLYK